MSVIAVKRTEAGFLIASDSQTSWGNNKYTMKNVTDPKLEMAGKIFQVNGMTIGTAGSLADIGYLQIFCKSHCPKDMNRDDILDWFMEFKDWCNKKSGVPQKDISVHAIIIKDKKCFTIFDFMMSDEIKDFAAVGSGMWVALGAMEVGADANDAVKAAIKFDMHCGGEVFSVRVDDKITINK